MPADWIHLLLGIFFGLALVAMDSADALHGHVNVVFVIHNGEYS